MSSSSLSVRLSSLFYISRNKVVFSSARAKRVKKKKVERSARDLEDRCIIITEASKCSLFVECHFVRLEKTDRIPPPSLFRIETARGGVLLCVRDNNDVKRRRKPSHLENDDA